MLAMDAVRQTAVKTFNSRGCLDAPIAESFPDRFERAYKIELNHFLDVVQGNMSLTIVHVCILQFHEHHSYLRKESRCC